MRRAILASVGGVALAVVAGCSSLLGIGDVPIPAIDGGLPPMDGAAVDAPGADVFDAYIPKTDGAPCRFDDDAARFDDTCGFGP